MAKKKQVSVTPRTLAKLRADGYLAEVVEKWNPHARIRQDLFGIFDILALHPEKGFLGVQCTTQHNAKSRIDKLHDSPNLAPWLAAGGKAEVWGWYKEKNRWHVEIEAIGGMCLACRWRVVARSRLCRACYDDADARERFCVSRKTTEAVEDIPLPPEPTDAPPGSLEKIEVMEARALAEVAIFHPEDAVIDVATNPGVEDATDWN